MSKPSKTPPLRSKLADCQSIQDLEKLCSRLRNEQKYYYARYKSALAEITKLRQNMSELEGSISKQVQEQIEDRVRQARLPRVIYVAHDQKIIDAFEELYSQHQVMSQENAILYETNNRIQEENDEIKNLQRYYDEIIQSTSEERDAAIAELDELKRQIQQLEGKVMSKQITINSMVDKGNNALLIMPDEQDHYPGEAKDMILQILEEYIQYAKPTSRRHILISSVLKANQPVGVREKIMKAIKQIFGHNFTGSKSISAKDKSILSSFGFSIKNTKDHSKIYLDHDERSYVTIPYTPSDGRSGMNTVGDIFRDLL